MTQKNLLIVGCVSIAVIVVAIIFMARKTPADTSIVPTPTPTPELAVVQLPVEKQPEVTMKFSADGHYATVNITNLNADLLEYNLIYDAKVKNSRIQTGVNAETKITGKSSYSQQQLLGSESSGKFSYHLDIQNAIMELTLRDLSNRSVFTATYPFTVTSGKSQDLTASQ